MASMSPVMMKVFSGVAGWTSAVLLEEGGLEASTTMSDGRVEGVGEAVAEKPGEVGVGDLLDGLGDDLFDAMGEVKVRFSGGGRRETGHGEILLTGRRGWEGAYTRRWAKEGVTGKRGKDAKKQWMCERPLATFL